MIAKLTFLMISLQSLSAGACHTYKPVCGENNVTYANACQCQKARVAIKYEAPCNRKFKIRWVEAPKPKKKLRWTWHQSHPRGDDRYNWAKVKAAMKWLKKDNRRPTASYQRYEPYTGAQQANFQYQELQPRLASWQVNWAPWWNNWSWG